MTSLLPFRWHSVELVLIVGLGVLQWRLVGDARRRRRALGALVALALVTLWPVGDLAATVSLSVATVQRLVIMLLVAPSFLLSLSTDALARLTRPTPVDAGRRRGAMDYPSRPRDGASDGARHAQPHVAGRRLGCALGART